MKLYALLMAFALTLVFVGYALAQSPTAEPTTQPVTAPGPAVEPPAPANGQDLVNGVTGMIAAFAGILGAGVTNLIRQIPALSNDNQDKLISAANEIIAVLVNVATGLAVAVIAQGLDLIPDSSLQMLTIAVLTPVAAEAKYRLAKFSTKT